MAEHITDIVVEDVDGRQLLPALPIAIDKPERTTRTRFLKKFLRVAGRLPFAEDLAAAYYCALDPATSRTAKTVLFGAIAYFVLPIDVVPDMLTGLGFVDDASILAAAVGTVGAEIKDRHRIAARRLLGRPGRTKAD